MRLRNASRLAGFARRADLPYLLERLVGAEYVHEPLLTPTRDLFTARRGGVMGWPDYEERFVEILNERRVERVLERDLLDGPTALLCSEAAAEHCHRRLVLEYLDRAWGGIEAVHL